MWDLNISTLFMIKFFTSQRQLKFIPDICALPPKFTLPRASNVCATLDWAQPRKGMRIEFLGEVTAFVLLIITG